MPDDRQRIAERFDEAELADDRFINVVDGEKGTRDHDTRYSDPRDVPGRNYGIYPGDGIVDVDIDDYGDDTTDEGLDAVLELPETLSVESPHTDGGQGGHRYLHVTTDRSVDSFDVDTVLAPVAERTAEAARDDPVALALAEAFETPNPQPTWGEVRAVNQYVVGPGSQLDSCDKDWCDECATPEGGRYTIAADRPIATIDVTTLIDALRNDPALDHRDERRPTAEDGEGAASPASDGADNTDYDPAGTDVATFIERETKVATYLAAGAKAAGFTDGNGEADRSKADFHVCCRAIEHGVPERDVRTALEESVHTKANERGGRYWRRTWGRALDSDDVEPNSRDPAGDTGGTPTWDQVATLFDSDANGSTTKAYNMAADLVNRTHDFLKIRESDGVYHYEPDRGYYVRKGETYLEEILNDKLGEHANARRRREISDRVAGENYVASDDFHPPQGKVNVENGVLDLDTRDIEPHSPEYYFTSQVRAEWPEDGEADPDAVEIWTGALADATDDPRERRKIEEFIGYTLETWHHDREKNLFLVGPRLSGKSTIQEAIEALFGSSPTVTNLTPQQVADTQFDAAALREAALNTVNDINARKIEDTGTLKRVFSGERMKMEHKYKDAHFAAPNAKHLFTANWLPRLVGQDDAVYRRILLVEFTNTIEDHEKDRGYKKRLKRNDVRQAILKRAVDARDRLHSQDGFTNDRSPNETRQLWDSWRDGHKRFLYTQFEITGDPDDTVDRRSYWQAYREFATRKGFELKSNVAITKSLQYVPEVYATGEADTYGGLTWRDHDAATNEVTLDGDPPLAADETRQASLDTQRQRHKRVRAVVRDLAADGTADREAVVEAAVEAGMTADRAEHILETQLKEGRLMEPQSGEVRPI